MKEFTSSNLRNVGVLAHDKAGKTSLTEAILFTSGMVKRLGKVVDGTSTTDYEPEEIKRKVTMNSALAYCLWHDNKFNFIDTPGFIDFLAEIKGSMQAVDSAPVVLCATAGVEVETERVWRYASELKMPRLVFVNKMDREHVDFHIVVKQAKSKLKAHLVPIQMPIGAESEFRGVIDLLKMRAYIYESPTKFTDTDIPEELLEEAQEARREMIEGIADVNDELLNKYLEGTELTDDELMAGLIKGVREAAIFPIVCGSAISNIGTHQLLDAIEAYLPSPETVELIGTEPQSAEMVSRKAGDPFAALVFKTTADPFVGRLSYIRIISGKMQADNAVYNSSKDASERVGSIMTMCGKQQDTVKTAYAGDIVVVAKLQETTTGDTLCDKNAPVVFDKLTYPKPMFTMCLETTKKGDEDKIGNILARIIDEDQTIKVEKSAETGQLLITGMGELHLEITLERIRRKFGITLKLSKPKVPYRETIRGTAKVEGKHKKQSGGHGQFGHVWLNLEPLPAGEGFEFVDAIFGGAVPRQYIPAVEKGAVETLQTGILAGYPTVDVKVTLLDGSYHSVDSSEMAFKTATAIAIKKALAAANPILLEPIGNLEVDVPESFMGDIIGDVNAKRGRILGMDSIGNKQGRVKAQVPLSEMCRYAMELRAMTQSRGSFDLVFSHYEEVPPKIAEKVIEEHKEQA